MMWKEWTKYGESENGKNYELMVGSDVQVLFIVRLHKLETNSSMWMAGISTFNPSAGEYVLYEDVFSSLEKAEEKAWEKAQEVVRQFKR
jgi:hypothetical protein